MTFSDDNGTYVDDTDLNVDDSGWDVFWDSVSDDDNTDDTDEN